MERRDWSLKALKELIYINSLDAYEKADSLVVWYEKYLDDDDITKFDLDAENLKALQELFYRSVEFLKKHKEDTRKEMIKNRKVRKFT